MTDPLNPCNPCTKKMRYIKQLSQILIFVIAISLLWFSITWAQEQDDPQYQLGAQVYADNCALCHGADGEGRVGAVLAHDWPSIRPDLLTRESIAEGVEGSVMPAWSQENGGPLSDEEIDAVIYFILSWQTGGAPQITPGNTPTPRAAVSPVPGIVGDPNLGGVLYDENCAVCHGVNGEGRVGATLAKDWPSIRPDLVVRSAISKGVEGSVMPAWSQENGGPLSDSNLDDLVAFLMTWSMEDGETVEPETEVENLPLSGWSGVWFTLILFVLIVAVILLVQFYAGKNNDIQK